MAPDKPWKPPALGSPIWIEIPATDVARTYNFYKQVFNWPFYGDSQPAGYDKAQIMLFEFSDPRVSGGVVKVPSDVNSGQVRRGGRGGACVWWLVADVQEIAPAIEREGGRLISGVMEEGKNGHYRYFEDPEGNVGVVYQFVGKVAEAAAE
ncbi:Glyoxalase/Bleomycin resistance protein/Dihydroxybiphenyl dioxygenase [Whalleya microplaca]|nr:Glyoxalase/Bleomycin resistance protein/Dihydroxybiphenyl dioxygenase [Whalleya microplaca]